MRVEKIVILKLLSNGRPTIPEMAEEVGKANATVHKMLQELVEIGLVRAPRHKGAARDYRITSDGQKYLEQNGYIRKEA